MTDEVDRGALTGAAVSSAFGGLWAWWGSGGLSGAVAVAIAVVGPVTGAALAVRAGVLARRVGPGARPALVASGRYWIIVGAEVAAILVGDALLAAVGVPAYAIAWTAAVVGAHFLAFGRVFTTVFTPIGWALVGAAAVGTLGGLLGGPGVVQVVTGVLAALVLLGAAARTVLAASRGRPSGG